jgi:hypothetical protein
MRVRSAVVALVAITQLAIAAESKPVDATKAAISAAEHWLSLVDGKKYDDSWKESATFFRSKVSQQQWNSMLEQTRSPLGNSIHRAVTSSQPMTTLPGAPNGKYVIIQFKASFQNRKDAIETVTPMLEKDGTWHVAGYFIK